jgi:Uma2 family endonuclease
MSLESFLFAEEHSTVKHEYHDGLVIAMAGATPEHVTICTNLSGELYLALKGKPCRPYGSDLRVWIASLKKMLYPDLSIICGPIERAEGKKGEVMATNPRVIFEVASKSSRNYDRRAKLE